MKGAKDGLRAFFLEMQEDAKSAAQIIYDALNSALDRSSDNLAKALTGQKTAWGKEFQDIGQHMLQSSIKSGLQVGIGALGKIWEPASKIASALGLGPKKDGSSEDLAFWVKVAGAGAGAAGSSGSPGSGGVLGTGAAAVGDALSHATEGARGFFGHLLQSIGNHITSNAFSNFFSGMTPDVGAARLITVALWRAAAGSIPARPT